MFCKQKYIRFIFAESLLIGITVLFTIDPQYLSLPLELSDNANTTCDLVIGCVRVCAVMRGNLIETTIHEKLAKHRNT